MSVTIPRESSISRLLAAPALPGMLVWIGVRAARREPLSIVEEANLVSGQGIEHDHYLTSRNGSRQVTLIAAEDLAAIASFLNRSEITPELVRRNLVTRGVNLVALKNQRFKIGNVMLEGSGECAPCSRMEENLGVGGYNAMRGRGGITARVISSGIVRVGDGIERLDNSTSIKGANL